MNSYSNYSYEMKVVKQPPEIVASEEWFEVIIAIKGWNAPGREVKNEYVDLISHLHINPAVNDIPSNDICSNASLVTSPDKVRLNLKQSSKLSKDTSIMCKIQSPSLLEDSITRYLISFSPRISNLSPLSPGVPFTTTRPIQIVNAKLSVDDKNWPYVWFKDEGGKDKCIEAKVSLLDSNGRIVKKRRVPLDITLVYDNKLSTKVMTQEKLRLFAYQYSIDPKKGECTVRFRINDVSKNHQGLNFRLQISPDEAFDIAPTYTPKICVKSKRKKSQKRPRPEQFNGDNKIRPRRRGISADDYRDAPSSYGPCIKGANELKEMSDVEALRRAMRGVIDWTGEVINGLDQIKWEILGFAQLRDGSIDYGQPFYKNQVNPNDFIIRVLSRYENETRRNLRILRDTVENTKLTKSQEKKLVLLPQVYPNRKEQELFEKPSMRIHSMLNSEQPLIRNMMNMQQQEQQRQSQRQSQSQPQPQPIFPHPSPSIIGQQLIPSHHVTNQQYLNRNAFISDQYFGSLKKEAPSEPGLKHYGIDMHTMNQNHQESNLDSIQDEKVDEEIEVKRIEKTIKYVLAKQCKSKRTDKQLGFPAFNHQKTIVGLYRESDAKVAASRLVLLSQLMDDFGPSEILQATCVLEDAIEKNDRALHSINDFSSLESLVEHVLVYEWTKGLLSNDVYRTRS